MEELLRYLTHWASCEVVRKSNPFLPSDLIWMHGVWTSSIGLPFPLASLYNATCIHRYICVPRAVKQGAVSPFQISFLRLLFCASSIEKKEMPANMCLVFKLDDLFSLPYLFRAFVKTLNDFFLRKKDHDAFRVRRVDKLIFRVCQAAINGNSSSLISIFPFISRSSRSSTLGDINAPNFVERIARRVRNERGTKSSQGLLRLPGFFVCLLASCSLPPHTIARLYRTFERAAVVEKSFAPLFFAEVIWETEKADFRHRPRNDRKCDVTSGLKSSKSGGRKLKKNTQTRKIDSSDCQMIGFVSSVGRALSWLWGNCSTSWPCEGLMKTKSCFCWAKKKDGTGIIARKRGKVEEEGNCS